ncbi:MAG TPA: HDOD domain-containing protein [Rhodoferax sp.]|nr:HDOD domain-containing protein [Rhodoferax sp.]
MSTELTLRLAAAVESMPAFPKTVQSILALTGNLDCSPKDLVHVIGKDPVITIKVLRVVNSAYYSLSNQITSIDHAVVFLGFNTIKNLALSIAAINMLPANHLAGFDAQQYLLHSLVTAGIAKKFALHVQQADPNDCFVAGLLHDFGKVVVAQCMPAQYQRAVEISLWKETSLHAALREVIGVDHFAIGAMLVQRWRFAPQLIETIGCLNTATLKDTDMIACVFAANQICKHIGCDFGGSPALDALPAAVSQRLSGTLDELRLSLGDLTPMLEEARLFAKL